MKMVPASDGHVAAKQAQSLAGLGEHNIFLMLGSQQQHYLDAAGSGVGVGCGAVPCQNVGALAGQMTRAQKQSDAGIDLSQSILFLEMSQQQHPGSAGGPWAGG